MAYGIKLTKDKKVTHINDEGKQVEVDVHDIMSHIYSDVIDEIDGWTLRDIMEYIEPLGQFFGRMAWCDFDVFYKDMKSPAKKDEFISNIEYINIGWIAEIWKDEEYITEGINVFGLNDSFTDEEINEAEDGEKHRSYALDFSPINEIADIEIRLDETYKVIKDFKYDKPVFETKKKFTFLDIVWALLWEISFHGNPEDKEKRMKELSQMAADIKSGKAKTIPWEEVKEQLENKLKGKEK